MQLASKSYFWSRVSFMLILNQFHFVLGCWKCPKSSAKTFWKDQYPSFHHKRIVCVQLLHLGLPKQTKQSLFCSPTKDDVEDLYALAGVRRYFCSQGYRQTHTFTIATPDGKHLSRLKTQWNINMSIRDVGSCRFVVTPSDGNVPAAWK